MSDSSDSSARQNAIAAGLRTYQGKSCAAHPGAGRYVASKSCVECAKAARRRNVDTERDKLRKRAARALQKQAVSGSIICDIVGI